MILFLPLTTMVSLIPHFRRSKSKKSFPVKVCTLDADLEFDLEMRATGRELFDLVCRTIGLRETWYFGLQFEDPKCFLAWLKLEKKVLDQNPISRNGEVVTFMLLAKFYAEDVAEELVQEVTQHLFFLQVKQAILSMDIYCPPEASVLLASYAVQAKFGDFDEGTYKPELLSTEVLLPQRVIGQYQMTPEMWVDRIKIWYADHRGMSRDEAEMEYLKIAQDLDMYGVNYFPITNKKGTELWLGVTAVGLNVYERENKLTPTVTFTWSEIRHISFDDKKFVLRTVDKNSSNFVFFSKKVRMNKFILGLCIGNHDLFMRRRKPDSMEVQQMKTQAKEERTRRAAERSKLHKEKQLREQAERERAEMEQRLLQYQQEMKLANDALRRSEETAELLAEKSKVAEEETMLLSQKATEAEHEVQRMRLHALKHVIKGENGQAMGCLPKEERMFPPRPVDPSYNLLPFLRSARHLERSQERHLRRVQVPGNPFITRDEKRLEFPIAPCQTEEDKLILERKTREAEFLTARLVEESERRAIEAERLKDHLLRARLAEKQAKEKLLQFLSRRGGGLPTFTTPSVESVLMGTASFADLPDQLQFLKLDPASSVPSDYGSDYDLICSPHDHQLSLEIERERVDYLEKSKLVQEQLKDLRSEIEELKLGEKSSELDSIHDEQVRLGENKYSTLRKVKSGSTKARVAFFEEL